MDALPDFSSVPVAPAGGPPATLAVARVGAGAPVLLIAGLGGRGAFWNAQVSAFAEHFDVILHDHRGTGGSTRAPGPYSIAGMAADVLALMDALGLERAHMVGHSTGGAMVQHIAVHHPERLGAGVISASWSRPMRFFTTLFEIRSKVLQHCGPEDYLLDGQLRGFPARALVEQAEAINANRAARLAAFPGLPIEQARIDAILAHDLSARLGEITAPTMVICARDDQITPLPFSREIAAAIVGAQLNVLDWGGHFAPQSNPQAYAAAVLPFLQAAQEEILL